jgi:hypothetical protein
MKKIETIKWDYTAEEIRNLWSNGIIIKNEEGKKCRIGKMSYGDYFCEPLPERAETEGFNKGTFFFNKCGECQRYWWKGHSCSEMIAIAKVYD